MQANKFWAAALFKPHFPPRQMHHQEFQSLSCAFWKHKLTFFGDCSEISIISHEPKFAKK